MKRVIVSGYFNPLHGGHLDMIEAARELGDYLVVIVNNDQQAMLKKGKIILDEHNRLRLVSALREVDESMLAKDSKPSVINTLRHIRAIYTDDDLIFANGRDRDGERAIPETETCRELGIEMIFGVGSHEVVKRDSSSRINAAVDTAT